MKSKVKRRQEENNKKMQLAAKKQDLPDSPDSNDLRRSPAAKKLAELRRKKAEKE